MFRFILLTQLFFLVIMTGYGQDSFHYKSKFQWKAMACFNLPINQLAKRGVTDNFISYPDNSISWQLLSFNYFFSKHWGVDASFQLGGSSSHKYNPNTELGNNLSSKFSNYYITVPNTSWNNKSTPPFCELNKTNIGIIYRLEKDKFVFYPKFSVGITTFSSYSAEAYLKQKSTNEVFHLTYIPNGATSKSYLTVNASSTIGYRTSKNLLLFLDLTASIFKPNLYYTATTTDLFTGISSTENYNYENNISNLSIGMGIILEIDRIKRIRLLGIKQ